MEAVSYGPVHESLPRSKRLERVIRGEKFYATLQVHVNESHQFGKRVRDYLEENYRNKHNLKFTSEDNVDKANNYLSLLEKL